MNDLQRKSGPQDVFLYLLATISLYTSVFALISLLFDYVNLKLADVLSPAYGIADSIRWEMALLIVAFPVFVWTFWYLRRDLVRLPEKIELRSRRWLMYLTIFLAALLVLGDLVALLNNFLQGELTLRFGLKVLIILLVAGGTFWFYLCDLRLGSKKYSPGARYVVYVLCGLIAVAALAGFFLVGSPAAQRNMRYDTQKINDLQNIQSEIVSYWQRKSVLPSDLSFLTDSISGYSAPVDQQSGQDYKYRATGGLSFELCANFNYSSADNVNQPTPMYYPQSVWNNWQHPAGQYCFERTIDPALYKSSPGTPLSPKPL